jgi:Flp pilus assembly protein TadD
MHRARSRRLRGILLAPVAIVGFWSFASWAAGAAKQEPAAKAASADDKELEPATAKAREGKVDEALALIKERAAKHPEWPPAHLILARMLYGVNQPVAGRRALEQAATAAPNDPEVYLTLGRVALAEGRFSDAGLNFEHAVPLVKAGQGSADKEKMLRRECLAGLASVAEAREDWKTNAEHLNAWLELEPKNGQIRQRLGRALFMLGKPEDAYAALTQGVKDTPALEPAAVSMGLLYTRAGDFKKGEDWLDRALTLEPNSGRVHAARAFWLLERGRAAPARAEIDEAVKLDPTSNENKKLQALIGWHGRDLTGAEAILEPLHRDLPADAAVANLLALTLVEQDDAAKRARGTQLAEVNAVQFPRSHEVLATLGWALYRSGQLDKAEEKLNAAVNGVRTSPDIAYFFSRVIADKGRKEDARKLLETATNVPGAFAHRDDAAAFLKTLAGAKK